MVNFTVWIKYKDTFEKTLLSHTIHTGRHSQTLLPFLHTFQLFSTWRILPIYFHASINITLVNYGLNIFHIIEQKTFGFIYNIIFQIWEEYNCRQVIIIECAYVCARLQIYVRSSIIHYKICILFWMNNICIIRL